MAYRLELTGAAEGTKGDLWRIRVGVFRVLYGVDDASKIIEIARVLDRKEAYRSL